MSTHEHIYYAEYRHANTIIHVLIFKHQVVQIDIQDNS